MKISTFSSYASLLTTLSQVIVWLGLIVVFLLPAIAICLAARVSARVRKGTLITLDSITPFQANSPWPGNHLPNTFRS
ncbi:hypothetical protein [Spirosoma aerophilum]